MQMRLCTVGGRDVLVGVVGRDLLVVDAPTWEGQRAAGIATIQCHEPGWNAEIAVLQAILSPEFWLWCALDGEAGVRLIRADEQ